jgi:predicted transglutaminase-like cysteine proteinase
MISSLKQKWIRCTLITCLAVATLPCTGLAAPKAQTAETVTELFETKEFRGSLKALKAWLTLISKAREQVDSFNECTSSKAGCTAAARSWQQLQNSAENLEPQKQLKLVNQFFNRWPYRLDLEVYEQSDYWATPKEFMQFSGDCEDYSISKYFALRQIGYPANRLRIVVLKDNIRNLAHAVLAVYQGEQIYILDNISDLVLPQERFRHYQPHYSVNEEYRWAHMQKFNKFQALSPSIKGPENAK